MKQLSEYIIVSLVFILLIFAVVFNTTYDASIKASMYKQDNLALKHFKTCYDNVNGKPLEKINKCLSNSLTSDPTGDAFVVNLKDMSIVWDNSVDCKTNKVMYLTKDSVCKLVKNPKSCVALSNKIKLGTPGKAEWMFDSSPELDSWIVLPNELHNFDGSLRATNGITKQYIVVQGNQYDEYTKYFKWLKLIVNSFVGIMLFLLLVLFIVTKQTNECSSGEFCKFQR